MKICRCTSNASRTFRQCPFRVQLVILDTRSRTARTFLRNELRSRRNTISHLPWNGHVWISIFVRLIPNEIRQLWRRKQNCIFIWATGSGASVNTLTRRNAVDHWHSTRVSFYFSACLDSDKLQKLVLSLSWSGFLPLSFTGKLPPSTGWSILWWALAEPTSAKTRQVDCIVVSRVAHFNQCSRLHCHVSLRECFPTITFRSVCDRRLLGGDCSTREEGIS